MGDAGTVAGIGLIAVLLLTLPVCARRIGTAAKVLVVGYIVFGLLGAFAYLPTAQVLLGPDAGPVTYFQRLSPWLIIATFAALAAGVYAGAVLVQVLGSRGGRASMARVELRLPAAALWLSVACLAVEILGTGPGSVLRTPRYLGTTGPVILQNLSSATVPVATLVAGNVLFGPATSRASKFRAVVVLAGIEAVFLGQATRTLAVFFVLVFAGGWLTGRWGRRGTVTGVLVATGLALATLGVPLFLRGQPDHGLIPALGYLVSDPGSFFSGVANPLDNILLGAPLSMYVWRQSPPIDTHALWTSLNPLPGSLTDWAGVSRTLRLNSFEPYGAVGELLNHGWLTAIGFSVAVGALVETLTRVARTAPGGFAAGLHGLVVGIAGLLLLKSTQYNLRTEARLLYYVTFGVVVVAMASRARVSSRVPQRALS